MLDNIISGGQVFLHKVRMFTQVFWQTFYISLILAIILSIYYHFNRFEQIDYYALLSYYKAFCVNELYEICYNFFGKANEIFIQVQSQQYSWLDISPQHVLEMSIFQNAHKQLLEIMLDMMSMILILAASIFVLIGFVWGLLGYRLKSEHKKKGSNAILTARAANTILKRLRKASDFKIGKIPLVKDSEPKHFLVTGTTGAGKTNFMHNLLPQIIEKRHPTIIVDQTGEMISRYYNEARGDIIFNPFDARGKMWDIWSDCTSKEDITIFADILFSFNRNVSNHRSDPFWEQAPKQIFIAIMERLIKKGEFSIDSLIKYLSRSTISTLQTILKGTIGERYVGNVNAATTESILSSLVNLTQPLHYLKDIENDNGFSFTKYFDDVNEGSDAWLFLALKPGSASLTLPLISCMLDLALSHIINLGEDKERRLWIILDELSSLGKVPALEVLMTQGRKYGTCVVAGLQSVNQLYDKYGLYNGSAMFGQFGTLFFFRNTEPAIAKLVSSMSGTETITRQQKNTSFGASALRDGIGYNEHQQKKPLITADDLAALSVGECYALLPEPAARIVRMQIPEAHISAIQPGFIHQQNRKIMRNEAEKPKQQVPQVQQAKPPTPQNTIKDEGEDEGKIDSIENSDPTDILVKSLDSAKKKSKNQEQEKTKVAHSFSSQI